MFIESLYIVGVEQVTIGDDMKEIRGSISKSNICVWLNFKDYYSSGFRIVSEKKNDQGGVDYVVMSKTIDAFNCAMEDSNR